MRANSVRTVLAVLALFTSGLLAACAPATSTVPTSDESDSQGSEGDDTAWVVVMFENREDEFDVNLMEALFETEMAADEALQIAEAGWIDGNDVGANGYELYFTGRDPKAMWQVLEPVFAQAPVAWTRVELRTGLEDPAPVVLVND